MWLRLLYIVLLLANLKSNAQTPKVTKVLEGQLPSEKVWCTYQDKLGYLWIATSAGLCRYDGSELRIFTKEDGLWSNGITWLSETDKGELLVVCYKKGLNLIEIQHKPKIKTFEKFPLNYDVFLKEDVIIKQHCYNKINADTTNWYTQKKALPTRILPYKDDKILVNSKLGLTEVNIRTKKEKLLFNYPSDSGFYALHIPNNNNVFIGSVGNIYHLHNFELKEKYQPGLPEKLNINCLITDKNNNIFCNVAQKGIYVKLNNQDFFEPLKGHSELNSTFNHFMLDNCGNIWASSMGKGLFLIHNSSILNYECKKQITASEIQQLCYVPYTNELFVSGLYDMYLFKDNNTFPLNFPKVNKLEVNINSLEAVGKNIIGGKHLLNLNKTIKPSVSPITLYLKDVRQINKSSFNSKNVWITEHYKHYSKYAVIDNSFENQKKIYLPKILKPHIKEPFYIGNNNIWQATRTGLIFTPINSNKLYNSEKDSTNFFNGLFQNTVINKIYAFTPDSIWFATDEGLFGRINDQWHALPHNKKLKSKNVKDITFDNEGNVWFVTQKELGYYDYKNLQIFNEQCGFIQKEFSYVEYDTHKEKVIVANVNGMSMAKKDDLLNYYNLKKEDFTITSISIDSITINNWNKIQLTADNEEITFKMSLLNFASLQKPYFEYKLNNNDWIKMDKGELSLRNLKHNDYTIQFRASKDNINHIYANKIKFKVLPNFYQTRLFLTLMFLLGMLLIALAAYFIIKRNKEIANEKIATNKRITFLEQRALTASMNPHFIFNVLNAIQELIQKDDVLTTNHYIAKFGQLIRLYLDSSLEANVTVYDEIERIELYCEMEKLRFGDKIKYQINIDEEVDSEFFLMPGMSLQPYVENAIKHGIQPKGEGEIIINCFIIDDDELIFEIIDNGVGLQNSKNYPKTDGLQLASQLTKERITLFGAEQGKSGKVIYKDNQPSGTIVKIILPIIEID